MALALLPTAPAAAEDEPSRSAVLWQGLAVGMSPEEALAAVGSIQGVKSAKVRGKPTSTERLQVRHTSEKIVIADLPFELSPQFETNKLKEVWLAAPGQCSAKAVEVFQKLSTGLLTKYPQIVGPAAELTALEVARANGRALESGKPQGMAFAFANETVATTLIFQFKMAAPPPYPVNGGKLGAALYNLARTTYDQDLAECDGTGDRRMGVAIRYMARSQFDALSADIVRQLEAEQKATADKL